MSDTISIDEFYKKNSIAKEFDEEFYSNEYPEVEDFYQPYCKDNGFTERQRLYFHWVNYGKNLGLAFQIVDDLLDLRGSQAKMGKKIGKDAALGKQTYPAVLGEAASEERAHQMAEAAIDALKPFGEQAKALELLANFVVNRTQ